ncbi:hypothetical protein H8790_03655 [Oscillibacter hominis]|uniref:RiboL-PSP-HEPN domain-containing protein n=1 Tax=Oscillibacter hominis TaxID=2763056 RepID=A0A7G9B6F5_9FIRM|nr:HEPN domain-containing protein [Oscillibacter hominis]QNL45136.1 hypothetical protein H8790_03655 [Oscillibacter hominis]
MRQAKVVFCALMAQKNVTAGLYEYLSNSRIPLDSSDLLRWQWVLAVSALDKYIHDIVAAGMVEQYLNRRPTTPKFDAFQLSMNVISNISVAPVPEIEFRNEVIRKNSYLAFQEPDKIADALSFIWNESQKWLVISRNMATPIDQATLKTKLKNIVMRRNQIVHEGDCLSTNIPLVQQPISLSDTEDVIHFITELVDAIDTCVV